MLNRDKISLTEASIIKCIYWLAKYNEYLTLTQLLDLNFESDKDYTYANHKTVLHIAAESGSKEAVEVLLLRKYLGKRSINEEDINGNTALDLAREHKYSNIETILLKSGALKGSGIASSERYPGSIFRGFLPREFHHATGRDFLLALQNSSSELAFEPSSVAGLIFMLAENDEDKTLREFIKKAKDLNTQFDGGKSALHIAVAKGSAKAVTALLSAENEEKININIQDNDGKNPLDIAVLMGKTEIALQLLERGATTFVSQKPSRIAISIFESKMEHQNVSGDKNLLPKPITQQKFFAPEYPEHIKELSSTIDIPPQILQEYFNANDGRFLRLQKLQWYIKNYFDLKNPDIRLTKQQVLATSDQELSNLSTCKFLVQRGIFTVKQVMEFMEPQRECYRGDLRCFKTRAQIFERLEELRAEQPGVGLQIGR